MAKKSVSEKEANLLSVIEDAKRKLDKLQQKQKTDLGNMAIKHGLHNVDEKTLNAAFKKLAVELGLGK